MDQPKVKKEPKEWDNVVENVKTCDSICDMKIIQIKQESLGDPHNGTCENLYDANLDFFKEELQDKRFQNGILSEKLLITLNPVSNLCYNQQHAEPPAHEQFLQSIQSELSHCESDDYSLRHIKMEAPLNKVTTSKCTDTLGSSDDISNLANNMKGNVILSKLVDRQNQITPISLEETHRHDKTKNITNIEVKIEVKEELVTNEEQIKSTYRGFDYESKASFTKNVTPITNRNQMGKDQARPLKKKTKVNRANVTSDIKPNNICNEDEWNLLGEKHVKYENNFMSHVEADSLLLEVKFESDVERKEETDESARKTRLNCHMSTHSHVKPFACTICNYSTNHKSSLIYHMRTHTGEKPFSCKYCEYKCNRKSNLVIHTRTHTGEKPFACDLCDFKCILKTRLVPHMRIHTGERPFTCNLCNFKGSRKINLDNHMRIHTGEKPYACKVCDFKCNQKSGLLSHMSTHSSEKPFPCKLCDYKGSKSSNLVSHMRTHTGERPFSCDVCNKRFRDKCTLQNHVRTHTGERPYPCKLCNFRFGRKGQLANHMKTHTGEKPFSCDHCSFTCSMKNRLIPHMMNHTGQKPFQCKLCNYKGSRKTNLVCHMRIHAKKEPLSDIPSTDLV